MTDYTITNLIVICILGLMIKLFFGNSISTDGVSGPASSTMWGYGISALSIFLLSFVNYALYSKDNSNKLNDNTFDFMKGFIQHTLPSILTLLLLMYLIWLNVTYFKRINKGKVAEEYYDMSKMSTVVLFFQIFTLFKSIHSMHKGSTTDGGENESIGKESSIIYLLTLINIIFIIILNIILEYFSTDG